MKSVLQVKLLPDVQTHQALLKTMQAFNSACNYVSEIAYNTGVTSKFKLQALTYHDVKGRFELTAQTTILAIRKVADSYKIKKDVLREFRATGAITYDTRVMRFKGMGLVNLWTIEGRKNIPIVMGEYQKARWFQVIGQADLVFRNNTFYLLVTGDVPEDTPLDPKEFIGVDLGITNIATTSDAKQFCGKILETKRLRYLKLRAALQKTGTKSAKRHLQRIRKHEAYFRKDVNHCISKTLVQTAKGTQRGIGLEQLKHIRKKTTVRKLKRAKHSSWSFYQLQQFIGYKAQISGVRVIYINPAYTSKECHSCGHTEKANRKTQDQFLCISCGYSEHADVNAARNIRRRAEQSCGLSWQPMTHREVPRLAASPCL